MFKRICKWFSNLFKAKEPEERVLHLGRPPIIIERPPVEQPSEELTPQDDVDLEPTIEEEPVEMLSDIIDTVVLYVGLTKYGGVKIADEFSGPFSGMRIVSMFITTSTKSSLHSLYKVIVNIPKETTDKYLKDNFIEELIPGYLAIGVRVANEDDIGLVDIWTSSTSRDARVNELLSELDTEVFYNDNLAEVIINAF